MEINVQWKLCEEIFPTFKIHVKKDGVKNWNVIWLFHFASVLHFFLGGEAFRRTTTHLRKCILVRLGPTVDPSSGDNRLVCEMFSCQMSVHHPPFCVLLVLVLYQPVGRRGSRDSSNQVRMTRYGIIIHVSHTTPYLLLFLLMVVVDVVLVVVVIVWRRWWWWWW